MQGLMAWLTSDGQEEGLKGAAWRDVCTVRRLQWEKFVKTKLEDAVRLFNSDYRKGFQMMQARPPPCLSAVAPTLCALPDAHAPTGGCHAALWTLRTAAAVMRSIGAARPKVAEASTWRPCEGGRVTPRWFMIVASSSAMHARWCRRAAV